MIATLTQAKYSDIATLTREEYFNDPALVASRAIAAGVKGDAYEHHHTAKGRYTGKVSIRHKPLNNMDLFTFGKADHRQAVLEALAAGIPVRPEVLAGYPDMV